MNNFFFIADYFVEDIPGGGEINNEELINILRAREINIKKIHCHQLTLEKLKNIDNKNSFYVIANFINLKQECKEFLQSTKRYIIYEHDHKYLKKRNPAIYKNFKAPSSDIINYEFYRNAVKVLCQSSFHAGIVQKNLDLDNVISLGGNLWSEQSLERLREISNNDKKDLCSIVNSPIPHKNTSDAVLFCKKKSLDYELIEPTTYLSFLSKLGKNNKLVFFPKTPETLSRIVVEARMMGMSVITNNLVGATYEEWFELKGSDLVDRMYLKRQEITDTILKLI